MNLVQEPGADKEGIRTIGVLTKADMVRGGDTRRWIDVLAGRSDIRQLKYGYYVSAICCPAADKNRLPASRIQMNSSERSPLQKLERTRAPSLQTWRHGTPWRVRRGRGSGQGILPQP